MTRGQQRVPAIPTTPASHTSTTSHTDTAIAHQVIPAGNVAALAAATARAGEQQMAGGKRRSWDSALPKPNHLEKTRRGFEASFLASGASVYVICNLK